MNKNLKILSIIFLCLILIGLSYFSIYSYTKIKSISDFNQNYTQIRKCTEWNGTKYNQYYETINGTKNITFEYNTTITISLDELMYSRLSERVEDDLLSLKYLNESIYYNIDAWKDDTNTDLDYLLIEKRSQWSKKIEGMGYTVDSENNQGWESKFESDKCLSTEVVFKLKKDEVSGNSFQD